MKKIIYSLAAALVTLALCSCASSESKGRTSVYGANGFSGLNGTYGISDIADNTSDTAEADAAERALPAESSAATDASEDNAAEETSELDDAAPETEEETYETYETDETDESGETLDTYYIDEYNAYKLTKKERAFTKKSIFVGDSICMGFSEYKVVNSDRVYARGSVAARNLFEFKMYAGDDELEYTEVLALTEPEYVFLSMGMNDLNLTDEETYCENYRGIIDTTLENSDAVVYVCAITPINCEFTTNYRIDCFNVTMEKFIEENYSERVYYVDFAKHLKDSEGNLKDCFNGGDGIHLAPYAYYVALWEMNRTMIADGVK